jgi:hypothetical protein
MVTLDNCRGRPGMNVAVGVLRGAGRLRRSRSWGFQAVSRSTGLDATDGSDAFEITIEGANRIEAVLPNDSGEWRVTSHDR